MRELALQVCTGIVQLVVLTVVTYGLNFINKKVGQSNMVKYSSTVKSLVLAVEQEFPGLSGADKKAEVIQRIYNLIGHALTPDEISNLIEAAVKEMNMVLKNVSQPATSATPTETIEQNTTQQTQAPAEDTKPVQTSDTTATNTDNTAIATQATSDNATQAK